MRRQTRPFTVEIKQKRSYQKRGLSIWTDVDLSTAMVGITGELKQIEPPTSRLVDSDVVALEPEHMHKPQAEHLMVDPLEAEAIETATEPAAKVETPEKKKKVPLPRKAKAEAKSPARKNAATMASRAQKAPAVAVRTGRKVHSKKERTQKLAQIERSMGGGATLKGAAKQAGISEQTYYHWKKAAAPSPDGDNMNDLVALEEENKRLKSLLAKHLRKENAELTRKLGLQ